MNTVRIISSHMSMCAGIDATDSTMTGIENHFSGV